MFLNCKAIYYMNDFYSFKKIQIKKYCKAKKNNSLKPSSPEFDMITDLIKDYWCDLLSTGYLNSKSESEKEEIYKSVTIYFPYSTIPEEWLDGIIYTDFASFID